MGTAPGYRTRALGRAGRTRNILARMALTDIELRVLGSLVEKERTTPDGYPLTMQALLTACNQKTSRDPVTDYHLQDVQDALQRLRDKGLASTVQEISDRVPKHRHKIAQAWSVNDKEIALLGVLMLRGPQTPGELRTRTERYVAFADVADVERVLDGLAGRSVPLVANLGRGPGQSQDRWTHKLGADEERMQPRVRHGGAAASGDHGATPGGTGGAAATGGSPLAVLLRRVEALERRVEALEGRASGEPA